MTKRKELFYSDYTDEQQTKINKLILMCSEMDGSNLDLVEGVFKFAIMQGFMREEDSNALLEQSPYLMRIIIGGLSTTYNTFKIRQKRRPYAIRQFFNGLLHYELLIGDEYLKFREKVDGLEEVANPIRAGIASAFNGGSNV